MTIQAVIFDIGNVLIGWQPEDFYDRVIGEDRRRALFAEVDLHGMNDRVDLGEGFRDVIYETAAAHPAWEPEIRLWHDRWLELTTPVIGQSVRLLHGLRAKGMPVHALTNFGIESFDLARGHFDFLNHFDRTFVSGHMGVIKPAPEIYAQVEATLDLPPAALLFADDRPANVEAARERGWNAHLFEGPQGWADRLVAEGLLTLEESL
ncbi:HAD family hydrolase [Jannaschia marina]|uniref:HAD family hydrolase n=1 Tax=Jannaschia marina TaxID=2741674 RepID=UPI0015CEF2D0|nr:HAD family phosphatase [Jannaschia marina]